MELVESVIGASSRLGILKGVVCPEELGASSVALRVEELRGEVLSASMLPASAKSQLVLQSLRSSSNTVALKSGLWGVGSSTTSSLS